MENPSGGAAPAVRNAHPPAWLKRILNPVARVVCRSPLGRYLGSLAVLEFEGRRSGRHYTVPVMTYTCESETVVFTDAGWAWNFKDGAPVVVRLGGRTRHGTAAVVEPSSAAVALRAVLHDVKNPRRVGLVIDAGHMPTDEELSEVRMMIRLDLDRG